MQADVVVGDAEITGTLHYVTGYTGFNADEPGEQEGNFLALKINPDPSDGVTVAVELVGGTKGPVQLDSDLIIVIRVTNKDSQTVKVTATNSKGSMTKTYSLKNLTLEPKA